MGLYHSLKERFGSPDAWWAWARGFGDNAGLDDEGYALRVIIGAILVQNVAWQNADRALHNLEQAGLLDCRALVAAPPAEIEPLIRPAGYFRMKAKKLRAFAHHLVRHYSGSLPALFRRPLDALRAELLGVYGIGPETADCILCYAGGYPVMAMDAYTTRIMQRLGLADGRAGYAALQDLFHRNLPRDTTLFGEFHALIDALGHRICLKRAPRCEECPLVGRCPRLGVESQPQPQPQPQRDSGAERSSGTRVQALRGQKGSASRRAPGVEIREAGGTLVYIEYRDKKNSSGRLRADGIVLYISRRLPAAEKERHIGVLTRRLLRQQLTQPEVRPPALSTCDVRDDAALRAWATAINAQHYGLPLRGVSFRRQESRWGSCSGATGNIYISHRLRGGPRDLLEYVLIHEICHLAEFNHSARFWQWVARACPDYKQRRALLRQYERWLVSAGGPPR